ncbi:hypothetical protein [Carnobacterium pleistocenium]|uniref:hypothetical protein n=1 Tax=Carnobacterium pleistocenium TaxID=181073 RepID=UPI0005571A6F|nr:hypothetical protein [Carnobacterium pleistocenium]
MRNPTIQSHTKGKNTLYVRLSLIVLLGWTAFLSGYLLQPVFVKTIDGFTSVYHNYFLSEQMVNKESFITIADSGSTENYLVEEAQNLKQEKNQEVTVLAYEGSALHTEDNLKYKAETTSEGIRMTNFYHHENVSPDTTLSRKWDVSKNNFDLVSGLLTINLTIEDGLTASAILTQSKGLVELLMVHNAEKEIQAINLTIKSGKQNYSFESVNEDTLKSTEMIYTN